MEEYSYLIFPSIVGVIVLHILIFIAENENEIVCDVINDTLTPQLFIFNFFKLARNLGIVALSLYLLIEYTWWVVGSIATIILVIIVISCICSHRDYHKEMRIYNRVSSFYKKGITKVPNIY